MTWLKQLFSRSRLYGDLSEEIQEHLEEKSKSWLLAGCPGKRRRMLRTANLET